MKHPNWGYDITSHSLIMLKIPPPSLIQLREELQKPENWDITKKAMEGKDFSDSIGIIALQLDIALDGDYDIEKLCDMLVNCMRARGSNKASPHLRDSRLVEAEIIETEGEVTLSLPDQQQKKLEQKTQKED